ncbi:polysaccharide pyruvyl transferase family protein [Vibrio vulnificus]|nr:polysaccharide pyruvyl transferase family protein [Vibrio vulnificus]
MKYLVKGYFGTNNLGDDLILASLLENFFDNTDSIVIVSKGEISNCDKVIRSNKLDVKVVYNKGIIGWFLSFLMVFKTDVFVFGPGGVFTTDNFKLYFMRTLHLTIARMFNKKIVFLGVGFNKLENPLTKKLFKWQTKKLEIAAVRDLLSYENITSLVDSKKVVQTLDFAFFYPIDNKTVKENNSTKSICICLAQPWNQDERKTKYKERYEKLCAEIRVTLKKNFPLEYDFYFVPFHNVSDVDFARDVVGDDEYLISKSHIVSSETEMLNKIDYIVKSDFIFSMRFHSSVLSIILRKPFVAISYDFKISSLLTRFGLTNFQEIGIRNSEFFKREFDCDFYELERKIKRNFESLIHIDDIAKSMPMEQSKFSDLVDTFRRLRLP